MSQATKLNALLKFGGRGRDYPAESGQGAYQLSAHRLRESYLRTLDIQLLALFATTLYFPRDKGLWHKAASNDQIISCLCQP